VSFEGAETFGGAQKIHARHLTGMFWRSFVPSVRLVERARSALVLTVEPNTASCSLEHINMELVRRLSILIVVGRLTLQARNVRVNHLLLVDCLGVTGLVLRF